MRAKIEFPRFCNSEINPLAVGRPHGFMLAVVNGGAEFAAVASVGIDQPDVRILHGGFEIGEAALGAEVDDCLAVGRPERLVFGIFSGGEPPRSRPSQRSA